MRSVQARSHIKRLRALLYPTALSPRSGRMTQASSGSAKSRVDSVPPRWEQHRAMARRIGGKALEPHATAVLTIPTPSGHRLFSAAVRPQDGYPRDNTSNRPADLPFHRNSFRTIFVPGARVGTILAVRCCSENSERSGWGLLRFWNPGSFPRLAFLIRPELEPQQLGAAGLLDWASPRDSPRKAEEGEDNVTVQSVEGDCSCCR